MPITGTSAKGTCNIMLEATSGMQLALASTPVIATLTGITAPVGSTGVRYFIRITNWTTSGTVTITGTGTPGNTETYNIAAPTAQQTQSAQLASNEYVSANAYTAITNVTTTGLTNGTIVIYAIQAGKFQLPSSMKSTRKPKVYSPNEHNALIERDKKILVLTNETTIDEIKQDVYGDLSLWWPYMMMGAPTTTASIPAVPTSLLAAAPLSATQSLTSQPTAPGMRLILTVTAFTVAGTVTITGTVGGTANVAESISIPAAGTYYSSNIYTAVNASGVTNVTTAATVAITGVFGWSYTFLSSGAKYTAAVEWFDGAGSWTHPFCFATDGSFDIKVNSEATITLKGKAQDKLPIGDRTTTPLSGVNRIAAIGANLNDMPLVGWQTLMFMDAITGTPLTTNYGDVQELKVDIKTPDEEHWTFNNSQNFNRAYTGKRECLADLTINFIDMLQWEQFRQNLKQYLSFQFLGQYIGTTGGTNYFKSWTWTLPIRTDGTFDPTSDPSKGIVTAKILWRCEYSSEIGAAYRLVVVSTQPPSYTT